jgi:quercetin dioxygenase-like cupin family protein
MFVGNVKNIEDIKLTAPGVVNAFKKTLVGPAEGWEGWVMRLFTLGDKGNSPRHAHPWPHINYVVSGRGMLYIDGKENALEQGSVAYVPSGVEHQFVGAGDEDFVFICIVPEEGDK